MPGGGVEQNESPLEAVLRETKEELGFEVKGPRLIVVDYMHTNAGKEEIIHFVFFGGVLTETDKSRIVLQVDEIKAYKFVTLEEALQLTGRRIGPRIGRALKAISSDVCIYWDSR